MIPSDESPPASRPQDRCIDLEDLASFVLESVSEIEHHRVAAHLAAGCKRCQRELQRVRQVIGAVDLETAARNPGLAENAELAPPASLRSRLLQQAAMPEFTFVKGSESAWVPSGVEGVEVQVLSADAVTLRHTVLVRVRAGSSYPAHHHSDTEECFVLSGDLRVGDRVLRAGDYQRAEKGTIHPEQWTESGCTLLVVAAQSNPFV